LEKIRTEKVLKISLVLKKDFSPIDILKDERLVSVIIMLDVLLSEISGRMKPIKLRLSGEAHHKKNAER
jgi:hypothetical protein